MTTDTKDIKIASITPFGLRLVPELKTRVEDAAKRNGRSLNAEITARLEWSLQQEAGNPLSADVGISEQLDKRLRTEKWEMQETMKELRARIDHVRAYLGIVDGDD